MRTTATDKRDKIENKNSCSSTATTLKRHLAKLSYEYKSCVFKNDEHTQKIKSFIRQVAEISRFCRFYQGFFSTFIFTQK